MLRYAALVTVALSVLTGWVATPGSPDRSAPDLQGRVTFDFVNWITDQTVVIADVSVADGEFRRAATGQYGWRHPDGTLVFTQGCGTRVNRLVVAEGHSAATVVSPCSSEIETVSAGNPRFEFARLSPDKQRVAAELRYYYGDGWRYATVVVEGGEVVTHFDGFVAPAWTPDGRLLLAGDGIWITDVPGTPTRVDDGWLGVGVNNMDLNPDGDILVFEWSQRLWVMDIDGTEYKELVSGPKMYRFPAWSPDGHYVAFLSMTGFSNSEVDRAIRIIDTRVGEFHSIDLSPYQGNLGHRPFGPLSWTR